MAIEIRIPLINPSIFDFGRQINDELFARQPLKNATSQNIAMAEQHVFDQLTLNAGEATGGGG